MEPLVNIIHLKQRFIKEVEGVLKPNGYFCFTDFRQKEEIEQLEADLQSSGLVIQDHSGFFAMTYLF